MALRRPVGIAVAPGPALGPGASLGLARFACALLLPSMGAEPHRSFAVAAVPSRANAFGYLAGALIATRTARRWGTRRVFLRSLGATVGSLLMTAGTGKALVPVPLRAVAGVAGAACFITGAGLVAETGRAVSLRRATALIGICCPGRGAGIAASGLVIPWLPSVTPAPAGWRWGWVVLGGLGLIAFGLAVPAVRASREPNAHHPRTGNGPGSAFGLFSPPVLSLGQGTSPPRPSSSPS
ncbi:MAG: YbfB/YjiJ family MFS transporter [Candidatus Dormibacteria bacterium]